MVDTDGGMAEGSRVSLMSGDVFAGIDDTAGIAGPMGSMKLGARDGRFDDAARSK
jgi:hypothetical protein